MHRFLMITAVILALCVSIVFAHRVLVYKEIFSNAFTERLRLDSRLVDGQWTWREIHPGRNTFEEAKQLLRRVSEDGFAKQMSVIESEDQINWVKFGSPLWTGSLRSDADPASPRVYAVVINPPQGHLRLGDVLNLYGTPFIMPDSYGYRRSLCFPQGICVTTESMLQPTRMMPSDEVLTVSYMIPHLMYASVSDAKWQGFRRY